MLAARWMLGGMLVLTAMLATACGGGSSNGSAATPMPNTQDKVEDAGATMPKLPSPDELARTLSDAAFSQLDGAQFNPSWPNDNLSVVGGDTGRFEPSWISSAASDADDLAYGMYQFSLTGHDGTAIPLEMEWTSAPFSIYAGLANFAIGRWDWFPYNPAGSLEISDFASYTSGDQLVLCIVVTGTISGDLLRLSVGTNPGANDEPVAILIAEGGGFVTPGTEVNFDATESYDPDGTIASYDWDLNGDGTFEVQSGPPQLSETYSTTGTYDVGLRVTDNRGEATVAHAAIVVQDQTAQYDETESNDAEAVVDWVVAADKLPAVSFTGFRGSLGQGGYDGGRGDYYLIRVPKAGRLTLDMFFTDDDADLDMRLMSLNADGTTTSTLVTATSTTDDEQIIRNFTEPGEYYWYCYVYSNAPEEAVADYTLAATFETSEPPVADLQATPTSGDWPLTVNFDASGSYDTDGTIEKYDYDWDGNGTYDSEDAGPTPSYEYVNYAGELNPTVRVTDDFGLTNTASITVTVVNEAPTAAFTMDVSSGDRPLIVNFDASGSSDPDGPIAKYEWDFNGDGIWDLTKTSSSTDPTLAEGKYYMLGTFDATLRVTDETAQTHSVKHQITVTGAADSESEPNNDSESENTAADMSAANTLPAIPFANFCGQVGPKPDADSGTPGDLDDWFIVNVPSSGSVYLALDIFDAVCDIDMKLYDANDLNTTLGSSTGTDDLEEITVSLDAGTYYLRVYAYTGYPAMGGYMLRGENGP